MNEKIDFSFSMQNGRGVMNNVDGVRLSVDLSAGANTIRHALGREPICIIEPVNATVYVSSKNKESIVLTASSSVTANIMLL